jgi:hypothetical protein
MERNLIEVRIGDVDPCINWDELADDCFNEYPWRDTYAVYSEDEYDAVDHASWYRRAYREILTIKNHIGTLDDNYVEWDSFTNEETWNVLREKIINHEIDLNTEGIKEAAQLMNPKMKFEIGIIHGRNKSMQQKVIYRTDVENNLKLFEAVYFGLLYELSTEKNYTYITQDQIDGFKNRKEVIEAVEECLALGNDDEIELVDWHLKACNKEGI